jgi:ATP-binding cassette subfamily A (ABC1) protein 3
VTILTFAFLGGGYHLTIVKDENCTVENITALIKRRIPDVAVESNCGAELTYNLPDEKSGLFAEMFEELEDRKTELGIASYGASITTMEEVFVRVGREAERKVAETFERLNRAHGITTENATSPSHSPVPPPAQVGISMNSLIDSNSKTNLHEQTRRNTGNKLLMQQFRAMLVKKLLYISRNRFLLLGQMIVPVLYITIVLAIFSNLPALGNAPPQLMSLEVS